MNLRWLVRAVFHGLQRIAEERRVPAHVREMAQLHTELAWTKVTDGLSRRLRGPRYLSAVRYARRGSDSAVVRTNGGWQAAVRGGPTSVREIAEANLAAAADLLTAGDVPFFVRDAAGPGGIVIGIDEEHRGQALAALAAADPAEQLYVRAVTGRRPIPLRALPRSVRTRTANRLVVYRNHELDPSLVVGASHGCLLEVWYHAGFNLRPPNGAEPGRIVVAEAGPAQMDVAGRTYPTLTLFADHRAMREPAFPIDVVYTWVDDSDPQWQSALRETRERFGGEVLHAQAANASRYRNREELRYSLRSLALFAPFVRRIFIVTAGQVPSWLAEHPKVRVVDHAEILPADALPTFNSHSIESRLHHIEGLAEHYLYLNDDFLFGREVRPTTFFSPSGVAIFAPDSNGPIPAGPPSPQDRPVDSASKNVRQLMSDTFGMRIGRKISHAPYPQRRSVLAEMEHRFPEDFDRTAHSRFRHCSDLNIASCFSHYYAFATGRAIEGTVSLAYIDIARRVAPLLLRQVLRARHSDVVCINDTEVPPERADELDDVVARFLEAFLPVPSPFENDALSRTDSQERDHVGERVDSR